MLLISNWVPTRVVYKVAPGNFYKHWIRPIPGFDEEYYPFLVCSGRESFNLINVKDADMEKLINASCINIRCQPAFFFKEEDYGFSMHFATKDVSDENIEVHKWHMLPFKDDFRETVMTTGNLPVSCLAKKLRMASKLQNLTEAISPSKLVHQYTGLKREKIQSIPRRLISSKTHRISRTETIDVEDENNVTTTL